MRLSSDEGTCMQIYTIDQDLILLRRICEQNPDNWHTWCCSMNFFPATFALGRLISVANLSVLLSSLDIQPTWTANLFPHYYTSALNLMEPSVATASLPAATTNVVFAKCVVHSHFLYHLKLVMSSLLTIFCTPVEFSLPQWSKLSLEFLKRDDDTHCPLRGAVLGLGQHGQRIHERSPGQSSHLEGSR